jgi:hypothetical protein
MEPNPESMRGYPVPLESEIGSRLKLSKKIRIYRFSAILYPGRAIAYLNGSTEARSTRVALQLLQIIGSGGWSTIFNTVISKPNASSIRDTTFCNGIAEGNGA